MATGITSLQEINDKVASGKAVNLKHQAVNVSGTTVAAASGNLSASMMPHNLGTTLWSTIQETPFPAGITGPIRAVTGVAAASAARVSNLQYGIMYVAGTQTLTGTGTGGFSASAATFPIQRTKNGSLTDLKLIPFFLVTTATSTTAPVIKMNYVDGQGNSRTGTKSVTFPAAATVAGTLIKFPLEDGDATVKSISGCDVTTASSTGAGTWFLFEPLLSFSCVSTTSSATRNFVTQGWNMADLQPGTATSGTATSYRVPVLYGLNNANDAKLTINAFVDV